MNRIDRIKEEIALAIKQSGKTQQQIAELLNVKRENISFYVNGKTLPSLDTLSKLCEVLDLDANELLCIDRRDD